MEFCRSKDHAVRKDKGIAHVDQEEEQIEKVHVHQIRKGQDGKDDHCKADKYYSNLDGAESREIFGDIG